MHCYATNLKPFTYKDHSSRCSNLKDRIAPGILTLKIVVPSVLVQVDLDLTCYPKEAPVLYYTPHCISHVMHTQCIRYTICPLHSRVERCAYLRQMIRFMRARVNLPWIYAVRLIIARLRTCTLKYTRIQHSIGRITWSITCLRTY